MNIQDVTANPPVGWPLQRIIDYFEWAEKVVAGLRGVNKKLEDMFDECLREGRAVYDGISGRIVSNLPEQTKHIKPE